MSWTLSILCRRAIANGAAAFVLAAVWLAAVPAAASSPASDVSGLAAASVPVPGLPDLHAGERHEGILRRAQKRLGGTESGRPGSADDDAPDALPTRSDAAAAANRRGACIHIPAGWSAGSSSNPRFLSRAPPVTRAT